MTGLAAVGVGNDVVGAAIAAVAVNPAHRAGAPGQRQVGVAAIFAPDERQRLPAFLAMDQQTGLDDLLAGPVVEEVAGHGEGLGDNGAHGEIQGVAAVVGRLLAFRHENKAVLLGIVGEQRRDHLIVNAAVGVGARVSRVREQVVGRQGFAGDFHRVEVGAVAVGSTDLRDFLVGQRLFTLGDFLRRVQDHLG